MEKEILIAKSRTLENRKDLLNFLNEIKGDLLGDKTCPFTRKQLLILCNPKIIKKRYHTFRIPKKSGGVRQICSPCGNLKWFQICLNEIFKALYSPSPYAMGFTEGRSIVDNARMHTYQNYVFNIDLKDFFPSIDQARVWKRLQLEPFNFNAKVAGAIAGLCAIKSERRKDDETSEECFVLPQGAPTSPLLTNAVCDTLDRRLHGLAKRFGLHYSRYADDITFSSMHNVYQSDSGFRKELERIIAGQHFRINENKTRLCHCSKRQEVTGLTVGRKINVSRKYVKDIRAILHIWEKYGFSAAYATFYPRYKSEKCQLHRGEPNLFNIISGKLCYLKMVKGENDPVYSKLNAHFKRLSQDEGQTHPCGTIEYIHTMTKTDFEKRFGVKIKFEHRKKDNKVYGLFLFKDRYFIVAVSKNIDINNIPNDVQISLTKMVTPIKSDTKPNGMVQSFGKRAMRMGYLIHKPLGNFYYENRQQTIAETVSLKRNNFDIDLTTALLNPMLKDEMSVIESENYENLLERLVESNFDLSILP